MTSTHPTDPLEKIAPRAAQTPSRGKNGDTFAWAITDHVCRSCFGRILARETFDHRRIYRCSNCGIEREGRTEAAVCCCGIKLKSGADLGVRCQRNPDPRPEFPSEVVAAAVELPIKN